MNPIEACPVCAAGRTFRFLHRPSVPVVQNLVIEDQGSARGLGRGELRLRCCRSCGFVYNAAFEPGRVSYDPRYDNTQTSSPLFREHVEWAARRVVEGHGLRGGRFVEVGCGKGLFLRRLVELAGPSAVGRGFDPTYVGADEALDGRVQFLRSFYGPGAPALPADAVVCRHVIEHVARPLDLLRAVRHALTDSPEARVFFETPCVEWILTNRVVWDFFYEHCSYFTRASLAKAFESAGFHVAEVRHVFDGQYLWLEATPAAGAAPVAGDAGCSPALAEEFGGAEGRLVRAWAREVEALAARGGVALWGAGAKGATFANLIDPGCELIGCVVDLNPNKQGRFLPGTGHPIVAPAELARRRVASALVMNPNYRLEIETCVRDAGLPVGLVLPSLAA